MADSSITKDRLRGELEGLKARIAELEALEERRKHVEAALGDSELRYRLLYEETPAMYFTIDTDGTVLSVNPFGAEQLGYKVEELIDRPVLEVFHEEDRPTVREQLQFCVASPGKAFDWEFRKVRKDGVVIWVREVARAVRDRSGRTVVLIVCEDISRRKAVEQQLRESRERYRTLYTKTPVMLYSIDAKYRLQDVSDYWLEMLGYQRHEVKGRKITEFMKEASRKHAEEVAIPEFFRRGQVRNIAYQFVKKNGEVIDVLLSAIAERDERGKFSRNLAVIVDVTQQRRAEETLLRAHDEMERRVRERTMELEHQRRFLRQIIDVDPNFIFAKDREGRFTLVNEAVAEAYGTTVEDLIGKRDADFNPNVQEVEFFRRMDLEVMDTLEERLIPEERITDSTGKLRWLQTVKRPLVDEKGTASQVLGSATDITTRKAMEERLRNSEATLRQSQRELRALAGRLITAQEDERRRLAREMHDDLTQRVAALALQAGWVEQRLGSSSAEIAEKLSRIRLGLAELSSDIHDLSRRLHPSILDDLGLVDAMAAECNGFSQHQGFSARFEPTRVPDGIPRQVALGLYRITQEALWNVAKHAGTREARVSLRGEKGALALAVEDEGVGFNPDDVAARQGLGLASMKERARLIQAELSIDSRPGRGTIILVRVPLKNR